MSRKLLRGELSGGVGGAGGLVKKSRLRLGFPHPISIPGRLPKTVFWSILRVLGVVSFLCLSEEKRDRANAADARRAACLAALPGVA